VYAAVAMCNLAAELVRQGHAVRHTVVAGLLGRMGYSL
jgi:hypothetical protein